MTPSQLLLPPALQARLAAALAAAGVDDGLQTCIDDAAAVVSDYIAGYSLSAARTEGWTRTLAVHRAYLLALVGVPKDLQTAFEAALRELEAVRDGKFSGALEDEDDPPASPGAAVTEDTVLGTTSLR